MPQMLSDMTIEEISLVDDPANEQARVQIVKARGKKKPQAATESEIDDEDMDAEETLDDGEEAPAVRNLKKALSAIAPRLAQTIAGGVSADSDAAASGETALKEYTMDLENLSKALEEAEEKLGTLQKRADDAEAALATAQNELATRDTQIAELQKAAAPQPTEEDVLKSLPEPVRKRIEETEARAKAAEDAISKIRAEAELGEAVAKAKSLSLPEPEKMGPLLLRVAKGMTTAEDASTLEAVFKGIVEQGSQAALFKSLGSSAAVDGDPESLLKAKADEIQKANTGMTFEQAYAKAVDSNPALYNAYVAKRRAA
jgi:hypothetical protein